MIHLFDGTRNQTVTRADCKTILAPAVSWVTNAAGSATFGCRFYTKQNACHKPALFRTPLQKSARVAKPSGWGMADDVAQSCPLQSASVPELQVALFNHLKTKRRPLYLKPQSVPRCKRSSSGL